MTVIDVEIKVMSPIHLASGQADVNVDAEVIHEACGLPYFPAKRFKGLLYESALEVAEMGERCGESLIDRDTLEKLFHHVSDSDMQLVVSDFYIAKADEHEKMVRALEVLEKKYAGLLTAEDVLEEYTSVRYQTKLEDGVAADTSLHNMRVVDAENLVFYGTMELWGEASEEVLSVIALAAKNMSRAGAKRNRGFGRISCSVRVAGGENGDAIVKSALKGAGK
ncbi:RAMP superfamily CRISPR-associated protein [Schwartzia succinivorans]|jgi:CRISPR-associated protein Csx10|uniref:CRISPR/Cas system CSM-associated protein Csm3, group 7 of RAMP superfamily n=1 Tax=Schwartzia succinivorans DSM 10502 TaxID=1123243 RepID=A0A1M4ZB08_9FIRM|nr:RAMP superfamily CRISPR-associated protein [Schwartzia succinivorans]SHF14997.1 CRISPR/Cas system CSM-associated protein Csm3, group 7 of RAMP superfamily [Schwartzia succinivorans DSM 10502]